MLENRMELALNEEINNVDRIIVEWFMVENVIDDADKVDTLRTLPTRLEKTEEDTVRFVPVKVEKEP